MTVYRVWQKVDSNPVVNTISETNNAIENTSISDIKVDIAMITAPTEFYMLIEGSTMSLSIK